MRSFEHLRGMSPEGGKIRPPNEHRFSRAEQLAFAKRFWSCPTRLVMDGTWAALWRREREGVKNKRGGGAATSVLPLLALYSYPEGPTESHDWTPWRELPRRHLGRRAGVDKDTVKAALEDLQHAELLQIRRKEHTREELSGHRTEYRLSTTLFPRAEEHSVALWGSLFHGGTWMLLPTSACRHLYVVLACLDPVRDEDLYFDTVIGAQIRDAKQGKGRHSVDRLRSDHALRGRIRKRELERLRSQATTSLAHLARMSGLSRDTVIEALKVLERPMPSRIYVPAPYEGVMYAGKRSIRRRMGLKPQFRMPVLVRRGKAEPRTATWYAPDRTAQQWMWPVGLINNGRFVRQLRALWAGVEVEQLKREVIEAALSVPQRR